ncbi:VWA domain-containing protein, partial [Billgrantia gudaonensis]
SVEAAASAAELATSDAALTDRDSVRLDSIFSVADSDYGADGQGSTSWSYGLSLDVEAGTASGLTSGGESITLGTDGDAIVGSAADGEVFRLELGEDGDGNAIVELIQSGAIDHVEGSQDGADVEQLLLDSGLVSLTGTATIEDSDGDTAEASTSIDLGGRVSFGDDGPTFVDGGIDDASLSAAADSQTTGDLNLDIGADLEGAQIADATLKADGDGYIQVDYQDDGSTNTTYLTSGGEKLLYSFDEGSQRLTAYKDGDSSQSPVFTIDFDATGNIYQVNVVEALDPVAVSFAAAGFENNGGGIAGNLSFEGTDLEALFTSSEGSVNWSSNGIGAGNNLIGEGETLYAQFNEVLTQLDFEMGNDGDLSWEAFRGGDSVGTGSETSISIEGGFDEVHFYGSDGGGQYNVNNFSGAYLDSSLNYQLPVDVVAADGDGDLADSAFDIDFEPTDTSVDVPDLLLVDDNSSSTGLETAGGNDVLVGDVGGNKTNITPGQDYNVSLVVDSSGSIANQLSLLKDSLKKLADQLVNHDGSVNLQLVSFETNAETLLTLDDITNTDGALSTIESAIDDLDADGGTNYEAAFLEAKQWFDGQQNDYENLTFFLTDGDPTYHLDKWGNPTNDGSGSQTSEGNLQNAIDAFGPLSDISTVHGIGLDVFDNGNVNEDYLRYFDNTDPNGQATVVFGSTTETTIADFQGNDDPLDGEGNWTVIGGDGSVDRKGWGNYLELDSEGGSVTIRSDSFSVSEGGASIVLQYGVEDDNWEDGFSWSLEKLSGGAWSEVENGQLDSWQSYRTIGSDLGAGDYRLVFSVEDNSWGWRDDAKLELHDIELSIPDRVTGDVGQPSVIMSAEELDNVLEGGNTEEVPEEVGDDELLGGDGDDILLGDAVEHPDHQGEGFQGILDELESQNGQVPTNDQVLDYLKDNHESLVLPQDQGGDDTLIGGAGNDILYGGAGADTFAWQFGDEGAENDPAEDVVKDFTVVGDTDDGQFGDSDEPNADRLDLADLLQGEDEDSIGDYIFAEEEGDNVVLHISSDGSLAGDKDNADQTITLEGKSFADFGGDVSDSADLIQHMIDSGQLNIDQ